MGWYVGEAALMGWYVGDIDDILYWLVLCEWNSCCGGLCDAVIVEPAV